MDGALGPQGAASCFKEAAALPLEAASCSYRSGPSLFGAASCSKERAGLPLEAASCSRAGGAASWALLSCVHNHKTKLGGPCGPPSFVLATTGIALRR